jgi:hypothetical protein
MAAGTEPDPLARREFLKEVAVATLALQIAPLANACSLLEEEGPVVAGDAVVATTTAGLFGHFHRLILERELLASPPAQGIAVETTRAFLHRHSLRLSAAELSAIGRGQTITRQISSHRLALCLDCDVG